MPDRRWEQRTSRSPSESVHRAQTARIPGDPAYSRPRPWHPCRLITAAVHSPILALSSPGDPAYSRPRRLRHRPLSTRSPVPHPDRHDGRQADPHGEAPPFSHPPSPDPPSPKPLNTIRSQSELDTGAAPLYVADVVLATPYKCVTLRRARIRSLRTRSTRVFTSPRFHLHV